MQARERVAWAAGIYEGEGSCQSPAQGGLALRIGMTDLDVIESLQAVFGIGSIKPKTNTHYPGSKQQWVWTACGKQAYAVGVAMLPFLHERRAGKMHDSLDAWLRVPGPHRKHTWRA